MAHYYLDSSALVKRYVAEAGTGWVIDLCVASAGHTLYTVRISGAEIIAALFLRVRTGTLAESDAQAAATQFKTDFRERYQIVETTEQADEFFIGCDVSPCLFEMNCRLRGIENAVLDLAADPKLAWTMLERAGAFALRLAMAACERFSLDWLWTGDDVGGQRSMIMSPQCWRDMIRPHLALIFDVGKSRGLWVAYHACGSIRPIIPDLIEMGLDVLNPIQCNCPGMDPFELKAEFGKDLAFMGGIDTQGVLPNGTVDDVWRETARLLEGMTADGGGYILAASHTVPPETPHENIFAMYEVAGVSREEIFDRAADIRKALETCKN